MKIFISWSGDRSRAVAEALHDWLSRVIQAVEPFYTPYMEKGVKWSNEIDEALEGTRFGIVCLTPDNLHSDWIHYETGALSKTKDAVVWTFLHGLAAGDVPQPLGRFQHTVAEKADVLKLLHSINSRLREIGTGALKDSLLEEIFEETWSKFEAKLKNAEGLSLKPESADFKKTAKVRDEKDILNEILEAVRNQQRQINNLDDRLISLQENSPSLKSDVNRLLLREPFTEKGYTRSTCKILKIGDEKADSKIYIEELVGNVLTEEDWFSVTDFDDSFYIEIDYGKPVSRERALYLAGKISDLSEKRLNSWKNYVDKG